MKKKIYKALSVLLAVIMAFSVFACVLGSASAATEVTYYVGTATGTSPNGSQSNPYATVVDAINAANGLVKGDTLNIVALAGAAWGMNITPDHAFNIVVKSGDVQNPVTISDRTVIYLGGPTTLESINLSVGTSSGSRLHLKGNNFVLKEDASVTTYRMYTGHDRTTLQVASQTVVIDGSLRCSQRMIIGSEGKSLTYTNSFDLVLNDSRNTHTIRFYHGNTKFANTRINLKATGGVSFENNANADFSTAKLQIINSTDTPINATHTAFSGITDKWIINNNLGIKNLLSFTDIAGKFNVSQGYENVKANDGTNNVNAENGELTLAKGIYSITADKLPESKTFYVKSGATLGNGTKEKPYSNVCEAITAGNNSGLAGVDSLYVKLIGDNVIDWGTPTGHFFKLFVESDDASNKSTVMIPNETTLMGRTEFNNVILNSNASSSILRFNYNDVVMGKGVQSSIRNFTLGNMKSAAATTDANYVFNFPFGGNSIYLSNEWSSAAHTAGINIEVNNSASNISFMLSTKDGVTTYENVNFNIKNAASIQYSKYGAATIGVNGAFQVINSSSSKIGANDGALADIDDSKKYIMNNISGDKNLLSYTDTIGRYKVTSEYDVYAVKTGTTDRILPIGDYLILEAGEYTVNVDREIIVKEYYVSSNGVTVEPDTRPENLGTEANPVLTIADATRLISQDSLSVVDTAKIIIPAGDTVYWGENAETCAPIMKIQSSSNGVQATLTNKTSFGLVGNTEFKDVNIKITGSYQILRFNNYNVTFDTGSQFITNTYISLGTVKASTVNKDITLIFKGALNPRLFYFTSEYGSSIYNGNINILVDSEETAFSPQLGGATDTVTTYNGNINVRVLKSKTIALNESKHSNSTTVFNGTLTIIKEDSVDFPYVLKKSFNKFDIPAGKWYITNYSGIDDLVETGATPGTFDIKDGKSVYVRNVATKVEAQYTNSSISLPSGEYMISNKKTPKVVDDSHKMLHFQSNGGGKNFVYANVPITPGKTYIFECSYYTLQDSTIAIRRGEGTRPELTTATIISDKIVDNYHKVVSQFTVPKDYTTSTSIYVGLSIGKFNEGVMFDMKVYKKGDKSKTNLMSNNDLHRGLDEWALTTSFWGAHTGGVCILKYENYPELLAVKNFSLDLIKELVDSGNPQDGEWWDKDDIHEEVTYTAYTPVKGSFKDENGNPISGAKFVLVPTEGRSYSDTTNAKGQFDFGNVIVNFYDLYIIDKFGNKVHTGYSAYLEEGSVHYFNIVSDMSALADGSDLEDTITIDGEEDIEEIIPSGRLSGTLYTPMGETVPGIKLVIDGVGEVTTDENGTFAFANIPVGTYEIYTILSNDKKYVIREITIVENNELVLRLKYDPATVTTDTDVDNGWIIWVIIASVVALVVVGTLVVILVINKKKKK